MLHIKLTHCSFLAADKMAWKDELKKKNKSLLNYDDDYYDGKVSRLRKLLFTTRSEKNWKRKKRIYLNEEKRPEKENPALNNEPSSQDDAQVQNQVINEDTQLNRSPPRRKREDDTMVIVEHVKTENNSEQHSPIKALERKQETNESDLKSMAEHMNETRDTNNQTGTTSEPKDQINNDPDNMALKVKENLNEPKRSDIQEQEYTKPLSKSTSLPDKNNAKLLNDPRPENYNYEENNKELNNHNMTSLDYWGLIDWDTGNQSDLYDPEINWAQTFQVSHLDFQLLRNDMIDLTCNVSGNLLISESEAETVVQVFMEQFNKKNPRYKSMFLILCMDKLKKSTQSMH